jgi:hypothetical protein
VKLDGNESLEGEDAEQVQRVQEILARVPVREVKNLHLPR